MFRQILVPTDGRAGSRTAARFAARLARAHSARVHACYVIDRVLVQDAVVSLQDAAREEVTVEGRRALEQVRAICRRFGVSYAETLIEGSTQTEIVKLARRLPASLIVMHTAGRGRLAAFVVGSAAHTIVSRAPCPVLVLRQDARVPGERRRPRG